jgi:uncharacterized membrane protein
MKSKCFWWLAGIVGSGATMAAFLVIQSGDWTNAARLLWVGAILVGYALAWVGVIVGYWERQRQGPSVRESSVPRFAGVPTFTLERLEKN